MSQKLPRGVRRNRPTKPGQITTYIGGERTLYVMGFESGCKAKFPRGSVAKDIEQRVHFWHCVQPDWPIDRLLAHAIKEHGWAVQAQRKRRFGRVFG